MKQPFEYIVQQHGVSILRVCRALLDEHRAQDAWSETFLAALRAYPELDAEANVQAWLVRIAHNKAIDELRRRPCEQLHEEPGTLQSSPDPGPAEQAQNRELWHLVSLLPEKQRLVVAYRYLGDLDYRQIAQILGGTSQAARRASADGIANLRRILGDENFLGDK